MVPGSISTFLGSVPLNFMRVWTRDFSTVTKFTILRGSVSLYMVSVVEVRVYIYIYSERGGGGGGGGGGWCGGGGGG